MRLENEMLFWPGKKDIFRRVRHIGRNFEWGPVSVRVEMTIGRTVWNFFSMREMYFLFSITSRREAKRRCFFGEPFSSTPVCHPSTETRYTQIVDETDAEQNSVSLPWGIYLGILQGPSSCLGLVFKTPSGCGRCGSQKGFWGGGC